MSTTDQPVEVQATLRHDRVTRTIPCIARLLPCLYNHCYRRACLRVLADRTVELTRQMWLVTEVPWGLVQKVSAVIASEYAWPKGSLFLPGDECSVLFCLWRWTISDALELPCCIMEIEDEFGVELSVETVERLPKMAFVDLCAELMRLVRGDAWRAS